MAVEDERRGHPAAADDDGWTSFPLRGFNVWCTVLCDNQKNKKEDNPPGQIRNRTVKYILGAQYFSVRRLPRILGVMRGTFQVPRLKRYFLSRTGGSSNRLH